MSAFSKAELCLKRRQCFALVPTSIQASSSLSCQHRGAIIVQMLAEKNSILIVKTSLRHWLQVPNLFIAPSRRQQLFVVDKRPVTDLCAPWGIRFRIPNSHTRWRCNFKGLSMHGGRADFSKNLRASLFHADLSN